MPSLLSCTLEGLVAPVPRICWDRTLLAKAHRLAEPLWTKSAAMHPPCPGQHCMARCQQQTALHPVADVCPVPLFAPSSKPFTRDILYMLSQILH